MNVLVQRNCYRPGFRAARQCFCCKEVVIAHIRVARPLSMKLCTKKINISKKKKTKLYPLKTITGPKECRTDIFKSVHAPQSFSLTNRHVTQISI